ncbi:DUF2167 domain-containing protein [Tenacibaculum agarivorans]|uniref:DUF2167 domain-containing protein n=1 Tax=Tenacibaculum agarivorans TaxID=1908389 RepID=UPI00094BAD3D|nr:DUF2167 domain-containing protein [Tenacibaculum agarivorans]
MKKLLLSVVFIHLSFLCFSQEEIVETPNNEFQKKIDSINSSFSYKTGKVVLDNGLAEINVPTGYKFLDAEQSSMVLTDLWGNPPSEVLGMLFPENVGPISDNFTYAVEITYSDDGYINDEDAKDIDYNDLLSEMQNDTDASNEQREKLGYPSIHLVGWASEPFYDENTKKLHWAKELKFGTDSINTLNYNIRVLGRSGYLNLNAIGTMDVLPLVKNNVDQILSSVAFTEGNTYADFDASIDKVAAYGIGGLIAGKLLAKAGFFALILKFWKFIAIAVVGIFGALKNRIFGTKSEEA